MGALRAASVTLPRETPRERDRAEPQPSPRPDGRAAAAPGSPSSRPGSTCRSGRRWNAATSTTCPAPASRSPTSASRTTRTGGSRSSWSASTSPSLPPSLALRKEDAELDGTLDRLNVESEVRRHVEDFNERVVAARYRLPEGPPLVTMPRDVDETVAAWRERRTARIAGRRKAAARRSPSRPRPHPPAGAAGGDGPAGIRSRPDRMKLAPPGWNSMRGRPGFTG